MSKQEIIDIIRNSKPVLETRYGVKRLGLFGSYVREQQRKKSDIDLLVSFNHEIDLFQFLDLREFLETRLRHKVDLVMESALKQAIGRRSRNVCRKSSRVDFYINCDRLNLWARRIQVLIDDSHTSR